MDIVVGLTFWGGLILLTLFWLSRAGSTGSRAGGASATRPRS